LYGGMDGKRNSVVERGKSGRGVRIRVGSVGMVERVGGGRVEKVRKARRRRKVGRVKSREFVEEGDDEEMGEE
jgi:hypothetical protein